MREILRHPVCESWYKWRLALNTKGKSRYGSYTIVGRANDLGPENEDMHLHYDLLPVREFVGLLA